MKVRIEDKEALEALSWEELRAYLNRAKGWKYAEDIPGKAAVYQHKDKGGRLREVIVPLRRDFADYARRMGDAVSTLARVEKRSELDVYDDLSRSGEAAAYKVHARIRKWIAEEGWRADDVDDPLAGFNVMVTLLDGQRVNIFQRYEHFDHITVALHVIFSESDPSRRPQLSVDLQESILWSVERDVSIMGLEFAGIGVSPIQARYASFIYFDGLSKNALIQNILLVLRAVRHSGQIIKRDLDQIRPSQDAGTAATTAEVASATAASLTLVPDNIVEFPGWRRRESQGSGPSNSRQVG